MPFELSNVSASFQAYVNQALAKKLDIFMVVYIDDILIYTEDKRQDHVDSIKWVLRDLCRWGSYTNLKKCRFHQNKVCFLSYINSKTGIKMEQE